ncbi:MAG: hypothetical protein WBE48_13770 [Xanthobacteraceae bacterium]|jgi:hypothetical protein
MSTGRYAKSSRAAAASLAQQNIEPKSSGTSGPIVMCLANSMGVK